MVKIKKQIVSESVVKDKSYGRLNKKKYITVHTTGNTSKGADAQAHANLQSRNGVRVASWHLQVDDKEAIQSFDYDVSCFHAGDGRGDGNMHSIGVEACVNSDGNYKKTIENTANVVAQIAKQENIPVENIKQHNDWSGKNCPREIRANKDGISWTDFINMVKEEMGQKPSKAPASTSKGYLENGDKGKDVKEMQELLIKAGFKLPKFGADGHFGNESEDALKAMQKKAKIAVDGLYGANSKKALKNMIEDAKKDSDEVIYVVRAGDSLSKIAQDFGVKTAKIARDNKIANPNIIRVGQKLKIKGSKVKNYVVKSGDSLGKIAEKHNISLDEIKKLNPQVKAPKYIIYPNQNIRVK